MEEAAGRSEQRRPDPGQYLSDTDRDIIRQTWSRVFSCCEDVGVRVLIRFFSKFPSAKQYFSQFRHLQEPQEMQHSSQLRQHARRVMGAINSVVEKLGDPEQVRSVLALVGRAHAIKHKVDPMYFQLLSGVILEVFVEDYAEYFTTEAQSAWSQLMALICVQVLAAYTELGWAQNSSV
ncbi:cytoglobin-2 [Callorhinchus milii]|uniref:Cytoglobin n=1 Tax=Callorhinchus milii TaxID=7868 RepID=A0A0K1NVR7_CALMI|nr:cytoglobin-2 [Callorhinchus milii]AKU74648.1 cytoglobin [Callorhinchus milii]|eukprot:gi/632988730/ref/XP_007883271.1/ PREDICTED: cytoglobin-2-like [Callorhinchus milii]